MASIRQLSNSKWQAQIRRTGHKPITSSFIIKSDAAMWARQIESAIDRGIFLDRTEADNTSMAELFNRYLLYFHKLSSRYLYMLYFVKCCEKLMYMLIN